MWEATDNLIDFSFSRADSFLQLLADSAGHFVLGAGSDRPPTTTEKAERRQTRFEPACSDMIPAPALHKQLINQDFIKSVGFPMAGKESENRRG